MLPIGKEQGLGFGFAPAIPLGDWSDCPDCDHYGHQHYQADPNQGFDRPGCHVCDKRDQVCTYGLAPATGPGGRAGER